MKSTTSVNLTKMSKGQRQKVEARQRAKVNAAKKSMTGKKVYKSGMANGKPINFSSSKTKRGIISSLD